LTKEWFERVEHVLTKSRLEEYRGSGTHIFVDYSVRPYPKVLYNGKRIEDNDVVDALLSTRFSDEYEAYKRGAEAFKQHMQQKMR
jgi:hypothetical protein